MLPFLKNLFKSKNSKKRPTDKFLGRLKRISKFSHQANEFKDAANAEIYLNAMEQPEELFISLEKINDLLNKKELTVENIIKNVVHVSELQSIPYSIVEVFPIIEDEHVTLCSDVKTCVKHKEYRGDSIKIVTVRK